MAYYRLLDVARQFLDANGNAYSGGKLYTYTAGTTTDKATYQDDAGATPHANPIILDSAGRIPAEVWGTTGAYKLKLDTSADVTVWTRDDIVGTNDVAASGVSEWVASALTPTYVSGTSFTLAGDQTTTFHAGRRLKITDSGGTDYATIITSTYSDPSTTITVIVDSGSIDSGISAISYGLISKVNSSYPAARIKTGSYTGDGATSLAITGLGFAPKYVKIWLRQTVDTTVSSIFETTDTIVDDNAAGGAHAHKGAGGHQFNANQIIALGTDGFTVDDAGIDADPNKLNQVYNYLAMG